MRKSNSPLLFALLLALVSVIFALTKAVNTSSVLAGGPLPESTATVAHEAATKPEMSADQPGITLHSVLSQAASPNVNSISVIQLAPLDTRPLLQEDESHSQPGSGRRIGVPRTLPTPASIHGRATLLSAWQTLPEGGQFWAITLDSPEAKAIRVHLQDLQLPDGAWVVAYNTYKPDETTLVYRQTDLRGSSDVWLGSLFSSRVTVEYYLPAGANINEAQLRLEEISHIYVDSLSPSSPSLLGCHIDVTCQSGWANEATGVAYITAVFNGSTWDCSGALVNDLDAETWTGYFLTANHCLNGGQTNMLATQATADTLEFYWLYQTSTCNGAPPSASTVPHTQGGADLISNLTQASGNDHAFVRIRGVITPSLNFEGWTTGAPSDGSSTAGIHHPGGSYKRISLGTVASRDTNYWRATWSSGATEPGSSGSPLFDSNHRLIGQLFGDFRRCPGGVDPAVSDYGRFNVTYPNIERWLQIGGTIRVDKNYVGTELGTPTQPYRTINGANNFAWNGANIKIKPGSYNEAVTFTRRVTVIADGGVIVIQP